MKSLAARFSVNLIKDSQPRPIGWLVTELDQDVNHEHLSHSMRDQYLEQLKTYTRTAGEATPLCTRQGIRLLCRHGFDHGTAKTSRTALKCLANVMLLVPATRQLFVDLDYAGKAAELLKHDNREDEFLTSRILFLLTYGTDVDFTRIFTEHQLVETINANIARHAKYFKSNNNRRRVPSVGDAAAPVERSVDLKALEAQEQAAVGALSETLKLLFNLTQFYPDAKPSFSPSVLPILKLLQRIKLAAPPLQAPTTYLINALINLDFADTRPLFPAFDARCNVDRLLLILNLSLNQQDDEAVEKAANPLLVLIRRVYEAAPRSVRAHMRASLLPSQRDRDRPLGQADNLAGRLLRLSGSPDAPSVAKCVQELLFELSERDVNRFVRNIGYGFAAGFIMTHKLHMPESALDAWSTRDSEDDGRPRIEELDDDDEEGERSNSQDDDGDDQSPGASRKVSRDDTATFPDVELAAAAGTEVAGTADKTATAGKDEAGPSKEESGPAAAQQKKKKADAVPVNPITGQRLDMEDSDEEDPRTEDEKIREAERLFVLFERLRATGVVDIENPVAKAAREGRLQ